MELRSNFKIIHLVEVSVFIVERMSIRQIDFKAFGEPLYCNVRHPDPHWVSLC